MPNSSVILIQVRNPVGKNEPLPVLRVFDDLKMLRLKRAFFEDTLAQVARIEGVDVKIALAPPSRAIWAKDAASHLAARFPDDPAFRSLPSRMEVIAQTVAPIAVRTEENLRRCLDAGYRNTILMGGYIPTISTELLTSALDHLERHPLILGPTIEGGCYLIGLRADGAAAAGLIAIGTDVSYKTSTTALTEAGLPWQEIDLSYDVGHQEDLEFIVREINHCRMTGDEETARCTESLLAEYIDDAPAERTGDMSEF